jgi:adenylate kinase family enzyme
MGPIFILLGPPAAGKSTLSKAILSRFERGIHIPVDDLREFVVSGLCHPVGEWTEETTRQFELAERAAADLAARYSDAGFAVAIDHLHNPASIEKNIIAPLAPREVHRILLTPSLEVNLARNRERTNKPFSHEVLIKTIENIHKVALLEPLNGWTRIDNSELTIEETVDRILVQ